MAKAPLRLRIILLPTPSTDSSILHVNSETKINSSRKAEVVLTASEKSGVNFVTLQAPGNSVDQPVIEPTADGRRKRSIATSGLARMCGAEQRVRKWRKSPDRNRNTWAEEDGVSPDVRAASRSATRNRTCNGGKQVV